VTPGSNTQTPAGERTTQAVTADNFVRAETDVYFSDALTRAELGSFYHYRDPMPVDHQTVVRANRDTLYSSALVDLAAAPVTITLPDPGERFMSLMTISQDHYAFTVYAPGTFTFSKDGIGTRYVMVALRTFVDPDDPNDLPAVHALQDAVTISQPAGTGAFEAGSAAGVGFDLARHAPRVRPQGAGRPGASSHWRSFRVGRQPGPGCDVPECDPRAERRRHGLSRRGTGWGPRGRLLVDHRLQR
jgi:hypothetical protein